MKDYIKTDKDTELYYEYDKGRNKEVILFIHGPGVNCTSLYGFSKIAQKYGYSTVLFDLRCHGRTKSNSISVSKIISDIKQLLLKLKISNVNIVAMCASSNTALQFQKLYPKIVKSVSCVDFPNKKWFSWTSWCYYFLAHILLGFRGLISSRRKELVDWSIFSNLKLYDYLKNIRKNMSLTVYLVHQKEILNLSIDIKSINFPLLILDNDNGGLISHTRFMTEISKYCDVKVIKIRENPEINNSWAEMENMYQIIKFIKILK